MSIIRVSSLRDGINAPKPNGTPVRKDFNAGAGKNKRGAGNMGRIARNTFWEDDSSVASYFRKSLEIEAKKLGEDEPIVVMVHGWNFDPSLPFMTPPHGEDADNPHARLFHFHDYGPDDLDLEMRYHCTSWPLGLGFEKADAGASGLAIGYGWQSKPKWLESLTEYGLNPYARAYNMAEDFAWDLVSMLKVIADRLPDRPIDIFCHSLGSRPVIRALAMIADPDAGEDARGPLDNLIARIGRVIFLAGAERVMEAQVMMKRLNKTKPDRSVLEEDRSNAVHPKIPEFYNFLSRENDVLDKLGENFGPDGRGSHQVIGHNGLEKMDPAWLDVQLDDPDTAKWFSDRGYQISGDNKGVFAVLDHWIHFTWPDNMRVYHDILRDRGNWAVAAIKDSDETLFKRQRIIRRSWWE